MHIARKPLNNKERAVRSHSFVKQVLFIPVAIILFGGTSAYALPEFLQRFSSDPFARAERRGQCSTCHVNPMGGGERNPFGIAFDQNNREITPALRASWPDRFLASVEAPPQSTQSGGQV